MVPTSVVSTISTTFIVWRVRVGPRTEASITSRVIEGNCRATGDAWACVVWNEDVWFVMLGWDKNRLDENVKNMFASERRGTYTKLSLIEGANCVLSTTSIEILDANLSDVRSLIGHGVEGLDFAEGG
jgi:hypothetical protein